jgi:hypothetical protein
MLTPTETTETRYPDSVYEMGAWLKAHPWVKRVKVDTETFWAYITEAQVNQRINYSPESHTFPVLMWRHQQAMIPESDWYRREALFPARIWRRNAR